MKTSFRLLLLAFGILLLAGCESNGKKYNYNSTQNVYYKGEGVDESSAKKLAEYLNKLGYFKGTKELSVQITKEKDTKDTLNINFVVDESKITPKIEKTFILLGGFISQNVYNAEPVNVNFIGPRFKLIKKLGYARPMIDDPSAEGVQ